MPSIEVIAFSPEEAVEEPKASLARCKELMGQFSTTWINIVGLDEALASQLEVELGLHPLAMEDCLHAGQTPKVEEYGNVLFTVTRVIEQGPEEIETSQLSLFTGPNFVLTIHRKPLPQLVVVKDKIRKRAPRTMAGGPDYLTYRLLDAVVDSYFPFLDRIEDSIEDLEEEVMENPTRETLDSIHAIKRDLITLRRALRPQRDVIGNLQRGEYPQFNRETRTFLRDVYDHMLRVLDLLDSYRELTSALLEVYLSNISNSTNEVMKVLTIIATIMLPLTLIAGIYGMNFRNMPELASPYGYFGALLSMAVIAAVMLVYFRRKGWL
jgi:magnesium transporter